jgi:hypothetical protein
MRFIRKGGRVIPIRDKSENKPKPILMKISEKKVSAGTRFGDGFKTGAKFGSIVGGISGLVIGADMTGRAAGAAGGAIAGAAGGALKIGALVGVINAAFGNRKKTQIYIGTKKKNKTGV